MAIYMPPICRKKKVLDKYSPDTFRVISQDAETTHQKSNYEMGNEPSAWRKLWLENSGLALPDIRNRKTEVLPRSVPDYRLNKPHPRACGFLRHNVSLLNEPICSVYTEITKDEQDSWWPSRVSDEPLKVPPHTSDTIYRGDFAIADDAPTNYGSRRHTANPNVEPALGSVPVNFLRPRDGKQRLLKEKMSYEHQYNCRIDPNYPIRGKRHGSFVWDPMSKDASKGFVNHYSVISVEEGARREEQFQAEKLAEHVQEVKQEAKDIPNDTKQEPESVPVHQGDAVKEMEKSPAKSTPKSSPKNSPKNSATSSTKRKASGQGSCSQQQKVPANSLVEVEAPPADTSVKGQSDNHEKPCCTDTAPQV